MDRTGDAPGSSNGRSSSASGKKPRRRRRRNRGSTNPRGTESSTGGASSQGRGSSSDGPEGGDLSARLEAWSRDLRAVIAELVREETGAGRDPKRCLASIQISFNWSEVPRGQETALDGLATPSGEQLLGEIRDLAEEIASARQVLRPGRTFCFWCESSDCEHSLPSNSQAVFAGYSPTGQPEWVELTTLLLEDRDDRVESLYRRPPAILSRVRRGQELKENQLRVFGRSSRSYNILAQAHVGLLRLFFDDRGPETGVQHVAVSLQAVESRGPRGGVRLDLNLVGVTEGGISLTDLSGEEFDERVVRHLGAATRELKELEQSIRRGGANRRRRSRRSTALLGTDLDRVLGIVQRMARGLERIDRQRARRTKHAEDRAAGGERPTAKAFEDALSAEPDRVLADRRTGAFVVLGPRSRVHVFSPAGKHITSLALPGDKVEKRLTTRRWAPVDPKESQMFLKEIELRRARRS